MRRPERAAGLLALLLGLLHLWLAPSSGTDLAVQVARASFARSAPLTPVDLSWYGGVHPFGYSLLSPWVMAVTGVQLAGLVAAVAGSVLLARLFRDCPRPWLAAVAGAVFVTADVVSGRTTFALGLAAGLGALCVLPRRGPAAAFAVLTALLSPVAAAFLGLSAAVLVLHRRPGGWTLGIACTAPVLLLSWLFPGGGVQPFTTHSARPALIAALLIAVLAGEPLVRTGAVLYALAVLAFLNHADPFGSNVLRLGLLLALPVLLASARGRRLPVLVAALFCLWWQVGPPEGDLRAPAGPPMQALRAELLSLGSQRVEVVAPRDHGESSFVAERVLLARGWARQQDYVLNPLFYKGTLSASRYVAWLREHAVDHVAVPRRAALDFGSAREGALLKRPVAGLTEVWRDQDWVVFAVAGSRPLATPGTVLAAGRTELRIAVAPGTVDVDVRWSRWLTLSGPACLRRAGDHVQLRVTAPGTVVLGSSLLPQGHC